MKSGILWLFCFLLASCSFFHERESKRAKVDSLTQEEARFRKDHVSHVSYDLKFNLTKHDSFSGTAKIQFRLKNPTDLNLDFARGTVQKLLVNAKPVKEIRYNGFYLPLRANLLKEGVNFVEVEFTHPYSNNGTGLHKYVDVEDGRVYLYSHLEPYNANKIFPCFDQPNLKATFTTEVLAPKNWHIVSTTRETTQQEQGEVKQWIFPTTDLITTYAYSLHGGEYNIWESMAKTKVHEIPIRLFARKSLAKYIDPEEWFELTRKGFVFFEDYFSFPYPYHKYDQLIVPDFNHGAMENVAAVTFNEDRYIQRGEKTRDEKRALAGTLFHEMAHMWFGNLVTMDWWNDLWLNESFATYAGNLGMVSATDFTETWSVFNRFRKQEAYQLDQSINTHPVVSEALTTEQASAQFDQITYGKGASVLKQLSYLIGDKAFRAGLKTYFTDHANSNTTLADFIKVMETASEMDLKIWEQRWLSTAMLNNIEVNFSCEKGKLTGFEIYQTGTQEYPSLRTHKTKVALLKKSGGFYKPYRVKSITYSGERTNENSLIGSPCPDMVYPNMEDYDYVTITLDKTTLNNIIAGLSGVQDPFLRGLMWSDLWQMVLNKKINIQEYLQIVEFNGMGETDVNNLDKILDSVHTVLKEYYPRGTDRDIWVKFFEQAFMSKIQEFYQDSELQRVWFDYLVTIAESSEVQTYFVKTLKTNGSHAQLSFFIDQDRRWNMISNLMTHGNPEAQTLLEKETKKDSSKRGELSATLIRSEEPKLEIKEKYFDDVVKNRNSKSLRYLTTVMTGLFPSSQQDLQTHFVDKYYQVLKAIHKNTDTLFVLNFTSILAPTFCDIGSSKKMNQFITAETTLSFGVLKRLKTAVYENDRCLGIRELLQKGRNHKTLQ